MAIVRHKTNPFLEGMTVPVKGKQVKLSKMGNEDHVVVNQSTGESYGTHLTTYKQVDGEQFVKLFTANIALTFDLSSAGIKAFNVLLWVVQHNAITKDEVDFDTFILEDFLKEYEGKKPIKLSLATFKRGINELEGAQILAKTIRQGRYFINPNFVFNGDRIAFTTLIERKKSRELQQDLPL